MRVLTVRQPWAWAIIHGGKDVENRSRNIAGGYRGPVAIHVAGNYAVDVNSDVLDDVMTDWFAGNSEEQQWPWHTNVGKIIGVVDLVDVHHCFNSLTDFEGCSDWAEIDAWHLVLANARPLSEPILFKGALGMRELPDDVAESILDLTIQTGAR